MFLSIGMLKLNYFLADIFILSAEKQPIKLSWRKIECLQKNLFYNSDFCLIVAFEEFFEGYATYRKIMQQITNLIVTYYYYE